jgi:DNA repair exonuclease SbcCD ATPase subunit
MKIKGKYNFIRIKEVLIRNFTLYTKDNVIQTIDEAINDGVYCLAGANGLGKTTFLNIINYALTGLVLEPNKEVYSPSEIVKSNKKYTERYFEGRINAKDKEDAEVEITFEVDHKNYKIIRGFTERSSLRKLEIYEMTNNKVIPFINTKNKSPEELQVIYENELAKDIDIGKFEYFVFFQLYVLTFDENRRMIFWDNRASTNALSIAFNYDLNDTNRILELKRDMESLESYGRNARWQATQIKNEYERLLATKKEKELTNYDELKKQYDDMATSVEEAEKLFHNIEVEYDTLLKRQNIYSSELLQLKTKYKKLFSQYSEPRTKLLDNQYISYSKKENKCFLCGATGHYVVENIEKKLYQEKCPICNTKINNGKDRDQEKLLKQLEDIDKWIEKKNNGIEKLIFETEVKKVELDKAEYEYYSLKEKLEKFEKLNSHIDFKKTGDTITDSILETYIKRFEQEDKKSKDYYKKRNKIKPEYENLLQKVNSAYKEAESVFVPLFKKLAKSFIGLDLNIYFKQKGSKDIALNFELLGTARTESHQLSESQRFFLDIALRMALAVYLSKSNNEATLLIDTPEGSLDIAYESRVGKMFADFVTEHNQNVIMTANINASQLLISLADKCGKKKMKFRRMLDWTDLTEIQKEGEYLFDKVYNNIEKSLNG